jgi:hypothetical protein
MHAWGSYVHTCVRTTCYLLSLSQYDISRGRAVTVQQQQPVEATPQQQATTSGIPTLQTFAFHPMPNN